MSIQELQDKFKGLLADQDLFLAVVIILVGVSSFALGRLSADREGQESAYGTMDVRALEHSAEALRSLGGYVGSKTGSKYHLPWCGGADAIKEENKIWFTSREEAEAQGYTPAANCKGI